MDSPTQNGLISKEMFWLRLMDNQSWSGLQGQLRLAARLCFTLNALFCPPLSTGFIPRHRRRWLQCFGSHIHSKLCPQAGRTASASSLRMLKIFPKSLLSLPQLPVDRTSWIDYKKGYTLFQSPYTRLFAMWFELLPLSGGVFFSPPWTWAQQVSCFGQWNISKLVASRGLKKCLHIGACPLLLLFGTLRVPCEEAQDGLLEEERPYGAETSHPRWEPPSTYQPTRPQGVQMRPSQTTHQGQLRLGKLLRWPTDMRSNKCSLFWAIKFWSDVLRSKSELIYAHSGGNHRQGELYYSSVSQETLLELG